MDLPEVVSQRQLQAGRAVRAGEQEVCDHRRGSPQTLDTPALGLPTRAGRAARPVLDPRGWGPAGPPRGWPSGRGPSLHSVGLELFTRLLMHF